MICYYEHLRKSGGVFLFITTFLPLNLMTVMKEKFGEDYVYNIFQRSFSKNVISLTPLE